MPKRLVTAYAQRRFALLFASLMLTIGVLPVVDLLVPRFKLLEPLLALNLAAAIASVGRARERAALVATGLVYVAVRGAQAVLGLGVLLPLSESLWIAACLAALGATARYALRAGPVDAERIFAALDAYLLAGLVFGVGYWLLEVTWPGSLRGPVPMDLGGSIYFSFVTIATLGYGDIVPLSEPARALAVLEAVGGQMYLAVLVARLVSLYSSNAR